MQQPVEPGTTVMSEPGTPTTSDPPPPTKLPQEFGGAPGPEPTRFGDWERNGRCTDF